MAQGDKVSYITDTGDTVLATVIEERDVDGAAEADQTDEGVMAFLAIDGQSASGKTQRVAAEGTDPGEFVRLVYTAPV